MGGAIIFVLFLYPIEEREEKIMKKKCGGLFKEFVKAIVKHTIVFILCK